MKLSENLSQATDCITEGLPDEVLCRVTYPVCNIDTLNHNRRMYSKQVWENVINDPTIQEKLATRTLFGLAEHPVDTQGSLENTSHVIHDMWIDEANNQYMQTVDVLNTDYGRLCATLLKAGCQLGMSTRAEGELTEALDETTGETYFKVNEDSYHYITTDFTCNPSNFKTYPQDVQYALKESIQESVKNNSIDESFASAALGNLSEKIVEDVKPVVESAFTELADLLRDVIKENQPDFNISESAFNELVSMLQSDARQYQRDKVTDMAAKTMLEQGKLFKNDLIEAKVSEANVRADFDKSVEIIESLEAQLAEAKEVQENTQLAAEVISKKSSETSFINQVELNKLNKTIATREASISRLNTKIDNLTKLVAQNESNVSDKDKQIAQLKEAVAKKNKDMKLVMKLSEKRVLETYLDTKASMLGLAVKSPKALLEGCKTTSDVERVLEKLGKSLKENALRYPEKQVHIKETKQAASQSVVSDNLDRLLR